MTAKQLLALGAACGAVFYVAIRCAVAAPRQQPLVRLAELEIDPAQLDAYEAALKEEIAASVRAEPGVLKLYAVSVKDHPNQIRIFEVYRDQEAYEAHLRAPHFLRYKTATQHMVISLKLMEAEPILLGSR